MQKLGTIAKAITTVCSVMIGVTVCLFFLQDLLLLSQQGPGGEIDNYALLVSDWAASIIAGVLSGWLVHFCIWDCLVVWLRVMVNRIKELGHNTSRANRAEQA